MTRALRWFVLPVIVTATAFSGVSPASAEAPAAPPAAPTDEVEAKVTGLEAQVQGHVDTKAADSMRSDLGEIVKLLPTVTDAKLRARVVALVPKILQAATKDEVLAKAALKALGDTADPTMWKFLRPYVVQPNAKEVPPLLMDAIEVCGKIKADDSVPVLIGLVEKSKRLEVATASMKALGNFGESKRMRERIVADLVATVRKDVPGVGYDPERGDPSLRQKRIRAGDEAQGRWDALSTALTPALNQLTGQNCASAHDWFDLHDRYKNNLGALFPKK